MPISYAERKKRRQAMLQQLTPDLHQRLALRHVEAVARLPQEAQQTLAGALSAGLRGISDAIALLQGQSQATVQDVLNAGVDGRPAKPEPIVITDDLPVVPPDPDPDALVELTNLLQDCFPGMPAMTAEALATDELLSGVLALEQARQNCFCSASIQSELVFVALCGLALRFMGELNRLLATSSHYRGALAQSGIFVRWSIVK